MAINRFSQSAPMEWKLPKTPLEPLAYALEQKQKRYDTAYALADELADQQIQALQQDRARANELVRGWNEQIDNMVTKYDGDYSRMYKDLGSLKRDISRTMKAGGEGNAIQTNYSNYYQWLKEQQDRLKRGEITADQLRAGSAYTLGNYKGVGEMDPVTGNFNLLQPEALAKYTNPDDLLHEALKNLAADEGGSLAARPEGFYIVKEGGKYEIITPERIAVISEQTLRNNPEYINFMTQYATHTGMDPDKLISGDIYNRAVNMANIYRKDNRWSEMDMRGNPIAVKMWEMEQQQANALRGSVMPGNIQNTAANKFKIKLGDDSVWAAMGRQGGTGSGGIHTGADAYSNRRFIYDTANKLIEATTKSLNNEAPAYIEAFEATVNKVTGTSEYRNADDTKRQQMLANAWNNKLESIQTISTNALSYSSGMLQEVEKQYKATAQRGIYHKVNPDGTLGPKQSDRWKKNNAEAIQKSYMGGIKPVDGQLGIETWIDGEQYQVTNLPFNDPAMQAYGEIVQFDAPYMGKFGEVSGLGGTPIGRDDSKKVVYAPEGTKMRIKLGTDLQRVGELIGPDGRKIMELDEASIKNIQADYTRRAAAEVNRGVGFSSQYYQQADPKQMWDFQN